MNNNILEWYQTEEGGEVLGYELPRASLPCLPQRGYAMWTTRHLDSVSLLTALFDPYEFEVQYHPCISIYVKKDRKLLEMQTNNGKQAVSCWQSLVHDVGNIIRNECLEEPHRISQSYLLLERRFSYEPDPDEIAHIPQYGICYANQGHVLRPINWKDYGSEYAYKLKRAKPGIIKFLPPHLDENAEKLTVLMDSMIKKGITLGERKFRDDKDRYLYEETKIRYSYPSCANYEWYFECNRDIESKELDIFMVDFLHFFEEQKNCKGILPSYPPVISHKGSIWELYESLDKSPEKE